MLVVLADGFLNFSASNSAWYTEDSAAMGPQLKAFIALSLCCCSSISLASHLHLVNGVLSIVFNSRMCFTFFVLAIWFIYFTHLDTLAAEVGPQWIWLLGLLR